MAVGHVDHARRVVAEQVGDGLDAHVGGDHELFEGVELLVADLPAEVEDAAKAGGEGAAGGGCGCN